jgi:6-phosphogluconolactonase
MPDVHVFESPAELARVVAQRLAAQVRDLSDAGRTPRLVLTGGTIAQAIYVSIDETAAPWASAEYWWGDERYVPEGHADRNDRQARDAFLDRVGVPLARLHPMPAHGCSESMAEAANSYAMTLPSDPFDVVLLGLGPDAHVASLFPGQPQLHETTRRVVEIFDSPKPPPQRITLTFPALNNTHATWFVVSGRDKSEAVKKVLDGASLDEAPGAGARGLEETVVFLDADAASKL